MVGDQRRQELEPLTCREGMIHEKSGLVNEVKREGERFRNSESKLQGDK